MTLRWTALIALLVSASVTHVWADDTVFKSVVSALDPMAATQLVLVPSECNAQSIQLQTLMKDYALLARKGKSGKTDSKYQEISELLFPKNGENSPCFKSLLNSYLVESVALVTDADLPDSSDLGGYRIQRLKYAILTAELANANLFVFLTPDLRNELGGAWVKPAQDPTSALGAYDCTTSLLYVDVTLRPYDLGATTLHEMDHLIRDKYLSAAYFKQYIGDSQENWQNYLLLDELLAVTFSATQQRNLDDATGNYWTTNWFGHKSPLKRNVNYKTQGDLSLISRNGPLESYFQAGGDADPWSAVFAEMGDPKWGTYFQPLANIVAQNYFTSPPSQVDQWLGITGGLRSFRQFPSLGVDVEPLMVWPGYYNSKIEGQGSFYDAAPLTQRFGLDYFNEAFAEAVVKATADLIRRSKTPSPVCQANEEAAASDKLAGYVGLKFGPEVRESVQEHVTPSTANQIPSSSQLKDNINLTATPLANPKGSGAGLRPDKSGVRPSVLIHPCLSLRGEL